MPIKSQPYDIQALVPQAQLGNYWLISMAHGHAQELNDTQTGLALAQSPMLIICTDAKSLINKYNITPTPHMRFVCLKTLKKLLHTSMLEAELEIPGFNNFHEASSWVKQTLMSVFEKIAKLRNKELIALECQVIPACIAMERAGLPFDAERWQNTLYFLENERIELKPKLDNYFKKNDGFALFGPEIIDLHNAQEVKARLEEILGVKLESTSRSGLKNFDHEAVKLLLKYRENSRMLSTYGENFLSIINNNRVHASFLPLGSPSGRLACQEPNLQALPNDANFQACITPQAGRALTYFDYGAFELRILAGLSGDPALLTIFNEELDIHSMTAQAVFNTKVSKHENAHLRDQAKILNFGLIYGMGEHALARQLNISLGNAHTLMNNYFKRFPKVLELLESLEAKAKSCGYVNTALGRRVYFNGEENPGQRGRLARNVPIQGTGADIAKLALCRIFDALYKNLPDAQIVNMIHDEFVVECSESAKDQTKKLVAQAMSDAFSAILPSIKSEISIN
jgi:DNA polymerase-1